MSWALGKLFFWRKKKNQGAAPMINFLIFFFFKIKSFPPSPSFKIRLFSSVGGNYALPESSKITKILKITLQSPNSNWFFQWEPGQSRESWHCHHPFPFKHNNVHYYLHLKQDVLRDGWILTTHRACFVIHQFSVIYLQEWDEKWKNSSGGKQLERVKISYKYF